MHRRLVTFMVALVLVCASTAAPAATATGQVRIEVLSNRADLISGGDALVAVDATDQDVTIELNGTDVTQAFRDVDGRLVGLVSGLVVGDNELTASASGAGARITITNHPIGGPVFAGPQVLPWLCQTEAAGLGPALDASCNAPSKVEYLAMGEDGEFVPYDPSVATPTTTTDQGITAPYVVRLETGTINRGIYRTAILHDPSRPDEPQHAWNHKLFYPLDGGMAPNHRQGTSTPNVLSDEALSRGFAVASASLNVFGQNANQMTSAETIMMVKEHLTESFGSIRYTFSRGGSGAAVQQQTIAGTYPGLLDGIMPSASFPDLLTSTATFAFDCGLLQRYFNETSPLLWAVERQRAAASGHGSNSSCAAVTATGLELAAFDPTIGCTGDAVNPGGLLYTESDYVYDADTRPDGARCTVYDFQVAMLGTRAPDRWGPVEQRIGHGFANRPMDAVGIQYGLTALESGEITAEQFVDLNEKIGGRDIDYRWQPQRSVADPDGIAHLYRSGQVNSGAHMGSTAIIDLRQMSQFEFHLPYHSWEMRARLLKANGHADNQVIWVSPTPAEDEAAVAAAFVTMDRWLAAVEADRSGASRADKVRRNRPAEAVDACWVAGRKVTDQALCAPVSTYFGDTRLAAGAPLANDVVKCAVRPLDRPAYGDITFTDTQWTRLQAAFPSGVCDFRLPSIGREPSTPWMTFAAGPGGTPLGPPPVSSAV